MSRDLCLRSRESGFYFGASSARILLLRLCCFYFRGGGCDWRGDPGLLAFLKTSRKSSWFLLVVDSGRDCGLVSRVGSFSVSKGKRVTSTGVKTTLQYLESAATRSVPGRRAPGTPRGYVSENVLPARRDFVLIFRVVKCPCILLVDCQMCFITIGDEFRLEASSFSS